MRNKIIIGIIALIAIAFIYNACFNGKKVDDNESISTANSIAAIANLNYTKVTEYKYDTGNYTEGMEFYNNKLYASGGLDGKSFIGIYDVKANTKKVAHKNDANVFAEGITILNDTLYQLTYKNGIAYKYDANTLKLISTIPWKNGEGWGLTNNGKQLIASNGTNVIYFLNPTTFAIEKTINVTQSGTPIESINELEYVDGIIYANRFTTDFIYKIEASSGNVLAVGDFSNLLPAYNAQNLALKPDPENGYVLNGIAYNKATGTFFVTGKNWPTIFEVKF